MFIISSDFKVPIKIQRSYLTNLYNSLRIYQNLSKSLFYRNMESSQKQSTYLSI